MRRTAWVAIAISCGLAVGILIAGLIPPEYFQGSIKRDGPLVHGTAFALLVLPLSTVWPRRSVLIVLAAVLFGVVIEVLQNFVGRAPEVNDIAANLAGALAGGACGFLLSRPFLGRG